MSRPDPAADLTSTGSYLLSVSQRFPTRRQGSRLRDLLCASRWTLGYVWCGDYDDRDISIEADVIDDILSKQSSGIANSSQWGREVDSDDGRELPASNPTII